MRGFSVFKNNPANKRLHGGGTVPAWERFQNETDVAMDDQNFPPEKPEECVVPVVGDSTAVAEGVSLGDEGGSHLRPHPMCGCHACEASGGEASGGGGDTLAGFADIDFDLAAQTTLACAGCLARLDEQDARACKTCGATLCRICDCPACRAAADAAASNQAIDNALPVMSLSDFNDMKHRGLLTVGLAAMILLAPAMIGCESLGLTKHSNQVQERESSAATGASSAAVNVIRDVTRRPDPVAPQPSIGSVCLDGKSNTLALTVYPASQPAPPFSQVLPPGSFVETEHTEASFATNQRGESLATNAFWSTNKTSLTIIGVAIGLILLGIAAAFIAVVVFIVWKLVSNGGFGATAATLANAADNAASSAFETSITEVDSLINSIKSQLATETDPVKINSLLAQALNAQTAKTNIINKSP